MSTDKYTERRNEAQKKVDMVRKKLDLAMSVEEKERTFFIGVFFGIFLSLAANIVDRTAVESPFYGTYALVVISLSAAFLVTGIVGWRGALKARSRAVDDHFKTMDGAINEMKQATREQIEEVSESMKKSLKEIKNLTGESNGQQ